MDDSSTRPARPLDAEEGVASLPGADVALGVSSLVSIEDPSDPRLADYVSLREATLRRRLEAERGIFIAEGEKVIRRAIAAGYRPRSFLLAPRWLEGLADVLVDHPEVPVYVVPEALAEEVTGFHVHRGALSALWREERHAVAQLLAYERLLVGENLVDHANVGSLLRVAAGLGWDGVLLSAGSADPLYRRAIKVGMGAAFSLPWARLAPDVSPGRLLREAGFEVVALALGEESVDLREYAARPPRRIALLLGTEGQGLSEQWLADADKVVRIGMHRGTDSLNVATAAAIACWALGPSYF